MKIDKLVAQAKDGVYIDIVLPKEHPLHGKTHTEINNYIRKHKLTHTGGLRPDGKWVVGVFVKNVSLPRFAYRAQDIAADLKLDMLKITNK